LGFSKLASLCQKIGYSIYQWNLIFSSI
jgi:hypothetical protein